MPTRHVHWTIGVFVLLLAALLAGCGGSDGDSSGPEQTEPTAVPQPTRTSSIYGATWTPVPSPTPLPLKTIAYTYVPPPTGTPVFLPTREPTEIPPTFDALAATAQAAAALVGGSAPSNTALLLSATLLNEEAATVLGPVIGSFIEAAPTIRFGDDIVFVEMRVLVRNTDGTTDTRPVLLEASVSMAGSALRLVKEEARYTDDEAPYEDPIGDFVLGSVDTALNNVLNDRYRQSNPGGGAFTIVSFRLDVDGLTVRTDAVAP